MPRSLVVSKFLVAPLALLGLGATQLGAEEPRANPSTWRWTVASILASQRPDDPAPVVIGAADYHPLYERYAPNGLPEPTRLSRP